MIQGSGFLGPPPPQAGSPSDLPPWPMGLAPRGSLACVLGSLLLFLGLGLDLGTSRHIKQIHKTHPNKHAKS